jgi:hypothetical protein
MGWRWHFVEVAFGGKLNSWSGDPAEIYVGNPELVPEATKNHQIACCRVTKTILTIPVITEHIITLI